MTERPIGSIFVDLKHGRLQVVESDDCEGCVYNDEVKLLCKKDAGCAGRCTKHARKDKKYVKFISLKK